MARSKTAQPKHSLRKIAVVVATAVSGMSVYAQAAVEPKEDTITVTAAPAPQESAWGPAATIAARQSATGTKTDTPIQKVPQSISVVTAEEMALHQPKSVKEALSYTPGVSVGTRGASNTYDHLIIRGFAAEGQSQNNYLNGLKLQGNFYNDAVIDPYMLERAEIMRGPVSVLYGKSSPGGLLNMVSKRPTTEPLKEVQFKAGTDSLFQTGFDFSDALDDDGVYSYRLTGLARSANAQQKGSEEQRYAIAPAFTWRPDDKTNFTFLSYFQNEPETGYYGWLPKEGTVEPLPNGKRLPTDFNEGAKNNTYSRNEKMVGYSFDHEFNDTFTVRQNLRFAENKTSQNSVYGYGVCSDPANAYSKQCAALAPADKGHYLARKYVVDDEKLQNFSVDTQLQSKFATGDIDHTLLTGVDFMRMRNDINAWFGYDDSVPLLNLYNPVNTDFDFNAKDPANSGPYRILNKQKQTGVYVQDQAQWDKVLVTLGGRYDWADQESLNRVAGTTDKRDDKQFTWRGGVNYLFDNGVTPYFSYSESFEPSSQVGKDGNIFAPSKGKQYEVGVKYVPEDRPIVVTGAVYNLTKTNNLMADPEGSFFSEMADLLNLQSAAETHLAQYEDFIRSMKPRFVKRGARPLLLTTLIDPRHMLVFGPNSLFQEILDEYGIPNAWQGETNFWGSTAVSIDRLAAYKDVDVLCFDHDNSKDMDALMATPLWQAMPFVRTGRFQRVPAVWFYGATLSAMHFVRVLDNAIGGKA
ncbi:ferrichrome porin FhuA [Escherichia coli]|nr:ferrichrome porin FhuA [Escherichia coli]